MFQHCWAYSTNLILVGSFKFDHHFHFLHDCHCMDLESIWFNYWCLKLTLVWKNVTSSFYACLNLFDYSTLSTQVINQQVENDFLYLSIKENPLVGYIQIRTLCVLMKYYQILQNFSNLVILVIQCLIIIKTFGWD